MNVRTFALILGAFFLIAGVAGFIPGLTVHDVGAPEVAPGGTAPATPVADAGYGYLFGLFAVNGVHNIVHILWGVLGLVAYRSFSGARTYARATAVVYGLVTVMGLIPGLNTVFGLMPVFGNDVWLHALIAIAAAYFGFAAPNEAAVGTATPRRV